MSQHSSEGAAWQVTRKRVLDRDGWLCSYCHKALEGSDATVDHLVSKAAGGTDDDFNLVACCRSCNSKKREHELVRSAYFSPTWVIEPI